MISERCSLGLSDDELSRWHDDDLNPARMALIRTHAASCAACQERLSTLEAIGAGLRGLEPPPLDIARLLADLRDTTSSAVAPSTSTPVRRPTSAPRRSRRIVTVRRRWRRRWSSPCWRATSSRPTALCGHPVSPTPAMS